MNIDEIKKRHAGPQLHGRGWEWLDIRDLLMEVERLNTALDNSSCNVSMYADIAQREADAKREAEARCREEISRVTLRIAMGLTEIKNLKARLAKAEAVCEIMLRQGDPNRGYGMTMFDLKELKTSLEAWQATKERREETTA